MQALHYQAPGTLAWLETPAPQINAPTDALLKPIAVAACDLDRLIATQGSPFPGQFVLGHEFCAEVIAVGSSVQTIQPGDTVIASFQPSCGSCPSCHGGVSSVCSAVSMTSMFGIGEAGGGWGGALADVLLMPWAEFNVRKLPSNLDPKIVASASDNLADGLRAVDDQLQQKPGASVLVAGAGSIPLYAIAAARFLGAETVTFASDDQFALTTAEAMGADCLPVDNWPTRFASHDITFDCTNNVHGLSAVVKSTAPYGLMTIASIYFDAATPVPLRDMYMKGITVTTGRVNSASQLDRVLDLLQQGLDAEAVAPLYVPFENAADALKEAPRSQKLIFTRG